MNSLYGAHLNEFYVQKVRRNFDERAARFASIKTPEEARTYVMDLPFSCVLPGVPAETDCRNCAALSAKN